MAPFLLYHWMQFVVNAFIPSPFLTVNQVSTKLGTMKAFFPSSLNCSKYTYSTWHVFLEATNIIKSAIPYS